MSSTITHPQTEQDELRNTKALKFTHAPDGKIAFNSGATVFGDLFMLGAFASTKTIKVNNKDAWYGYSTDIEGLKLLGSKGGEVVETIADTISSLGMLLAYVDREEVGDKHLANCAWLIAGLGELLTQVVAENREIAHSRYVLSKQSTAVALTPGIKTPTLIIKAGVLCNPIATKTQSYFNSWRRGLHLRHGDILKK